MLLRRRILAERSPARRLPGRFEDRVVAEAARAGGPQRDPAPGRPAPGRHLEAPGPPRSDLGPGEREDADVARAAAFRRQAGERGEELGVVLGVGRGLAREPAGPDAWPAPERIDLEAGVIGEGRQTGRPGREPGLDPGVGLERQAVLDRVASDPELVERQEVEVDEALVSQELTQLTQLVRRSRRDDEPGAAPPDRGQRRTVASAAAWASNSRPRPV